MHVISSSQEFATARALSLLVGAFGLAVVGAALLLHVSQWRLPVGLFGVTVTAVSLVALIRLRDVVRKAKAGRAEAYAVATLRTYGLMLTPAQVEALFFPDGLPTAHRVSYGATRITSAGERDQLARLVFLDGELRLLDTAGDELPRVHGTACAAR